ncbi:5' nucleotidase family-domain-containing protein [Mycotypha africana]|uniref:5' nucleotidase family-domain-containing protein n=1 Tax=Mycotypha africana TaxID=64632 RepID=UPI0023012315|nr:5' nucleotidase family-domain-containing protein [Mycotypha africana]KAI8984441.1 5' nucleotidase family-domain-containing protein [Mycotypha africana]
MPEGISDSNNNNGAGDNSGSSKDRSADDNSRSIELFIKSLQQPTKSVSVPRNASVLELKNRIQVLFDVDSLRQRLIFQGRVLSDDKNLLDYENLGNGKVIHLVIRPLDAPHNPANDEPQRQTTENPQRPRRLRSGYAVISVDASLIDFGNGGNNLLSNLFSFPNLSTTPPTPLNNDVNGSNTLNANSTTGNSNNDRNGLNTTLPSTLPANRNPFRRISQGILPSSLRPTFSNSSSNTINTTLNSNNNTASDYSISFGPRAGGGLMLRDRYDRAGDLRRAVEEGLSELLEGNSNNGMNRGTSTMGSRSATSRSPADQQNTYETRLARTLAYLDEIRHLLNTPVVEDPEGERRIHEQSRRNSLRTLDVSRERMANISDQRHRLALVVDEMANLLESTVPYLRNVAGILRQDDSTAGRTSNSSSKSTNENNASDNNNSGSSRTTVEDTQQDNYSSIFRAARIIQAVSLSNYFLGSLLAVNRNRYNSRNSSSSASDSASSADTAAAATTTTTTALETQSGQGDDRAQNSSNNASTDNSEQNNNNNTITEHSEQSSSDSSRNDMGDKGDSTDSAQYHGSAAPAEGGRRIIETLKNRYHQQKLQHIHKLKLKTASDSKNAILPPPLQQLATSNENYQLQIKDNEGNDINAEVTDTICGIGYTSPNEVFINNELNLQKIEIYGFDYDATNYTDKLSLTIYNSLRDILVDILNYPKPIKGFMFDPNFAIRGLHYDVNHGWLMKIDNMANIQLNTVHVGRQPVRNIDEVIEVHKGRHISPSYLNTNMFQLNDLFSIPQATLLSDVVQYFKDHHMNFHPRYLSDDVSTAARILHTGTHGIGGTLHLEIMKDISSYLERAPQLVGYLEHLRKHGKKTFLLTNSTAAFIEKGMSYLTSSNDWRDLFDCVIVGARKPDFYRSHRPFRRVLEPNWTTVEKFERGEIYQGGNMRDFAQLTGFTGQKVLYFGDHVFSDLIEATTQHGWHTGAIIHELEKEINIRNQPAYRHTLSWLLGLEKLLNEAQSWRKDYPIEELDSLIAEWRAERRLVRLRLKTAFNRSFGSVFRTYQNPSYFANKIRKFADIYMSNITHLQNVSLNYVFYPDRTYLPHERLVENLIDTGGKLPIQNPKIVNS